MGLIYKIDSPTGRRYVGQTRKTAERRIIQYKSKRSKKNKSLILLSIDKYGWDAHSFSVIEDNVPDELLNEREIYWITELKTYAAENLDGMNLTRGGDNRESWKNDKTRVERAKMRRGEKSPSWGKKWSEEMKKRIGESVSRYNKANGKKPSAECHKKAKEKQYVPVVVYDRNGDFVAEYPYLKAAAEALGLKPVMTLQASIIAIHRLSKGDSVGYGARYQCPQDMLVGVVAFGYGDGYPRSTQDGAPVLVNNVRCPLVGRVSMDMLTVDLTKCPDARVGDLVILWGQGLPVEEVASYTAGVNYDILTGVQNRVKFLWTPDASL